MCWTLPSRSPALLGILQCSMEPERPLHVRAGDRVDTHGDTDLEHAGALLPQRSLAPGTHRAKNRIIRKVFGGSLLSGLAPFRPLTWGNVSEISALGRIRTCNLLIRREPRGRLRGSRQVPNRLKYAGQTQQRCSELVATAITGGNCRLQSERRIATINWTGSTPCSFKMNRRRKLPEPFRSLLVQTTPLPEQRQGLISSPIDSPRRCLGFGEVSHTLASIDVRCRRIGTCNILS